MCSGYNVFQRDVALYSKDLWPLAVRNSGILKISEILVVLLIEELRGKLTLTNQREAVPRSQ